MNPARTPSEAAMMARKGLEALARHRHVELQHVLSEFAIERLLFRLGRSDHRRDYVLKRATLFRLWAGAEHRATWDLDLLGSGPSDVEAVIAVLRDVCAIHDEDGIEFDLHALAAERTFDLESLVSAVRATFARRGTPLTGEEPMILTSGVLSEPERNVQWRAFVKRSRLEAPVDVKQVVDGLRRFLLPVLRAAASDRLEPKEWEAGGPWRKPGEESKR